MRALPISQRPGPPGFLGDAAGGAVRLDWLDPLKAIAFLGILLNHVAEEFGRSPWFTNPSRDWPALEERLRTFFPMEDPVWIAIPRFLGWLGDAGPGVFIFASGLGLAYSTGMSHQPTHGWVAGFYSRRLRKLYPAYWAAHLVVAFTAICLHVPPINMGSGESLLSLMGLRLTSSTFTHINPSWWFIWTILQLYLLFPVLVLLERRIGSNWLLAFGVAVTIAARAVGILFVDDLYSWMTGLLGLTRLGEFTLGMWAASVLIGRGGSLPNRLSNARGALCLGAPLYAAGLLFSAFLPSTVASNLAVTAGLVLLFIAVWHTLCSVSPATVRPLSCVGKYSYGAYLIHQPFLKWAVDLSLPSGVAAALPIALAVAAVSVPVGALLERSSSRIQGWLSRSGEGRRRTSLAVSVSLLGALLLVDPMLQPCFERSRATLQILVVAGLMSLIVIELSAWGTNPDCCAWTRWWAISAAIAGIWVVPLGESRLGAVAALPVALLARLILRLWGTRMALAFVAACAALAVHIASGPS